jgi:heme/copper-type cytochrome/quinol oxidase subunit 2
MSIFFLLLAGGIFIGNGCSDLYMLDSDIAEKEEVWDGVTFIIVGVVFVFLAGSMLK